MNILRIFKKKSAEEKATLFAKKMEKKYNGRTCLPVDTISYSCDIGYGAVVVLDQ